MTTATAPTKEEIKSRMPNVTSWAITRDHLDNKASTVCGPRATELTHEQIVKHPDAETFKMYDDDGELYYTGKIVFTGRGSGFEPLDHYGMGNAGCTMIKYKSKRTGEWEVL